ncbi:MAG: biotin-dependent carboxyltransferase family protein [Marinoscillum sp.]
MAKIKVIKSGLYTSIQDLGRFGYRRYGVPVSGAMDQASARLANLLVNNPDHEAVIEITLQGPQLLFSDTAIIALTGADLSPSIDNQIVSMNQAILVDANHVLKFGAPKLGCRSYLSIMGGIKSEKALGSQSQYRSITEKSRLENGDVISINALATTSTPTSKVKRDTLLYSDNLLSVMPGPEFDLIDQRTRDLILSSRWSIGPNNRMGYQLLSENIPEHDMEITTSQVVPGTIQLTPSGKLMALMRDAQVTGGYPRILQLEKGSIDKLSQKTDQQQVQFKLVR